LGQNLVGCSQSKICLQAQNHTYLEHDMTSCNDVKTTGHGINQKEDLNAFNLKYWLKTTSSA